MNLNEHLTVEEFRAMGLDRASFERAAEQAQTQLMLNTSAVVALEPGDGTRYVIAIVRMPIGWPGPPYSMSSSFGPLYPWNGEPSIHPRYAQEHYVGNDNGWTATVIARFLNTLAERIT